MKGLTELAELLLEKEVIFSEDLERIFGKRTADVLKDEKEAAAKAIANPVINNKEVIKDDKKGKKSAEKIKIKSGKKEVEHEIESIQKSEKKNKTKKVKE